MIYFYYHNNKAGRAGGWEGVLIFQNQKIRRPGRRVGKFSKIQIFQKLLLLQQQQQGYTSFFTIIINTLIFQD